MESNLADFVPAPRLQTRRTPAYTIALAAAMLCLVLIPSPGAAQPLPIRVGADSACDHDTIIGAIFEAAGNIGSDIIYVANNKTYDEHLPVASDSLEIIGGFDNCSDDTAGGTTQIFAPSSPGRVVTTSGTSASHTLLLKNLELVGTNKEARGGVIQIQGDYAVTLDTVEITGGLANYGGGIYIDGSDGARLETAPGEITFINNNTAHYGGGGIHCTGPAVINFNTGAISQNTARGESSTMSENAGGGVALHNGCEMTSAAGGFLQGIYSNTLESPEGAGSAGGGGVSVQSRSVFIASGSSDNAALINNNTSPSNGGGIHASNRGTVVELRDTWVVGNQAGISGGGVYVATADFSMARVRAGEQCNSLLRCSRLSENSVTTGGLERGGAIEVTADGNAFIQRTYIEQNSAPQASVATVLNASTLTLKNVVAANNSGSDELMRIEQYAEANVHWSTLAYNALATAVVSIQGGTTAGTINLHGSIVWQPAIALVDSDSNATRNGDCVMAADFTGFPELTRTTSGPPGFLDVDDLRATPEGNAVDHCDSGGVANTLDLVGLVRPVDHPSSDVHGQYDLGAFEWREAYGLLFRDRFEAD